MKADGGSKKYSRNPIPFSCDWAPTEGWSGSGEIRIRKLKKFLSFRHCLKKASGLKEILCHLAEMGVLCNPFSDKEIDTWLLLY